VALLRPGDVDGDIHLLLEMAPPYTARAAGQAECLYLEAAAFERLLGEHPAIARRWLSSVAARLAASQARLLGLLGRSLVEQAARLLVEEAGEGVVPLPQRTLAAMLGVQRPSMNKVLKQFERRGLLTVGYRSIRILDRAALQRAAEGRP
jgi:CRP-like cAMP-binding protein